MSNIISFFFNLNTFVLFVFLFAVWLYRTDFKKTFNIEKGLKKKMIYFYLSFICFVSLLTIWSYVNAPERIFKNTNHHLLEHLGFSFDNNLILASRLHPEKAIWDSKPGDLDLQFNSNTGNFNLRGVSINQPIFLKTGDNYILRNPVFTHSIDSSLSITVDSSTVVLAINKELDYPYSIKYKIGSKNYSSFTPIANTSALKIGLSLGNLIAKAKIDDPNLEPLILALDSVFVLRGQYSSNNNRDIATKFNDKFFKSKIYEGNPLFLFGGDNLLNLDSIKIDNNNISKSTANLSFNIPINPKQPFFFGIWTTSTKEYTAIVKDSVQGSCEFLNSFPEKKYLKTLESEDETLFITSSPQVVAKSNENAGFYYPLLNENENENHFSANLAYIEGSTRDLMNFRVVDYKQNGLIENKDTKYYAAGDTISLITDGAIKDQIETSNTNWLLKITNTKATNKLQFWHMIVFNIWIVLCIAICFFLSSNNTNKAVTKSEALVYMIILTLLTIRSILLWRMSTFLPTEEISKSVFRTISDGGYKYFMYGVYTTTLFFLFVWIWKISGDKIATKIEQLLHKNKNPFSIKTFILFLLYLIPLCFKLGAIFISELERFGAVFIPIVVYISIELILLYRVKSHNKLSTLDPDYKLFARLNWLICFFYLAYSDAGFSIVFLFTLLVYWLIKSLTFVDYQFRYSKLFKIAILEFLIPSASILLFLFFAPNIVSLVFLHINLILYALIALLLIASCYVLFIKKSFTNTVISPKAVSLCLLLIASTIFLGKDKIFEKFEDKAYMRYRAEVLFKNPDEIIKDEEFKFQLGNDSKLLRAAQNQWIINYYYQYGKKGEMPYTLGFLPNPLNYFRIIPSFQKGSPYLTQICDLVSVRYLIGEHSQWLLIQLILLTIFLVVTCLDKDTKFNFFSKIRLFLACLLFSLCFYIWLSATNKIVFLGQDFPLISLNSALTLVFSFGIFFSIIVLGTSANNITPSNDNKKFNPFGQKVSKYLIRGLIPISLFALYWVREHNISNKKFDLDTTISNLQNDLIGVNSNFEEYQRNSRQANNSSEGLVHAFDATMNIDAKKAILKSDFALSAYEAYLNKLSKTNNPEFLIHLRKNTEGFYNFAVNKLYYNIDSPDLGQNVWRGHVTTEKDLDGFSFTNNNTNRNYTVKPNKINSNLLADSAIGRIINEENIENVKITQLPAGWALDSLPIVIVGQTFGKQMETRSLFMVKNGQDVFRAKKSNTKKINENFAVRLLPNDIIQAIPANKTKPISIQYNHQSLNFLAKNVWLNGNQQFFYPLENKFLWSYHFANLVKNKFDGVLKDQKTNIETTFDPGLLENNYRDARNLYSQVPYTSKNQSFALVIMDNNGAIKALSDYKPHAIAQINPNRMRYYSEIFQDQYLNPNIQEERLLLGNRCLIRQDNAPGSTFKPILYSAVTSQYNFNWSALEIRPNFPRNFFGGQKLNGADFLEDNGINSNLRDEGHDNHHYIIRSTNTYNSMIMFLGSLNHNQISSSLSYLNGDRNSNSFLTSGVSNDPTKNFPIFMFNNNPYRIRQHPDYTNYNSLLATGLWKNYDLPMTTEQLAGSYGANLQNLAFDLDSINFASSTSIHKIWSFPEPSNLFVIDRFTTEKAIVNMSHGGDPINTTPLKMAEMAAKLFSFNRGLKSTVFANSKKNYIPFNVDNSWGNDENMVSFLGDNLFQSMASVITEGTAIGLLGTSLINKYPNFHFYAKTGTISAGGNNVRDKHLMLIISQNNIGNNLITKRILKDNKFFVLYFSFYKQGDPNRSENELGEWDQPTRIAVNAMIDNTIKSSSFKKHMQ